MTQPDIPVQPGETPVTAALRQVARLMDWCVTHTTDGGHAVSSLHYSGRAVDLAARAGPGADTSALLAINEQIVQLLPLSMISELIYSGPGGICIKDGKVVSGMARYGPTVMADHHNHVHLGVIPTFTYNNGVQEELPVADDPNIPNSQAKIVAAFPTPSGKGYTIVTADGAVFCFGDAEYHGRIEVTG